MLTKDENGDINTVTLIGMDAAILDEAVDASDAEEEVTEETGSDTEA
ncbi:MAG: hypothetical protein LUF27_06205 [Lachnospiraceae bacterium]|nr:hypothetical protein [Lachnospiraceae bacterium]